MAISINRNVYDTASDGNGGAGLEPGAYVVEAIDVKEVMTSNGNQMVEVIWDIAHGEHLNHFADTWGEEHPYAHHYTIVVTDKGMWKLKKFMNVCEHSNAGFNPETFLNGGDVSVLRGLYFGAILQYATNNKGKRNLECVDVCNVEDVLNGNAKVPAEKVPEETKSSAPVYKPQHGAKAFTV